MKEIISKVDLGIVALCCGMIILVFAFIFAVIAVIMWRGYGYRSRKGMVAYLDNLDEWGK